MEVGEVVGCWTHVEPQGFLMEWVVEYGRQSREAEVFDLGTWKSRLAFP